MRQGSRIEQAKAPHDSIGAATAGLRRQFRIRNTLLTIVGIEAIAFVVLRSWSAF